MKFRFWRHRTEKALRHAQKPANPRSTNPIGSKSTYFEPKKWSPYGNPPQGPKNDAGEAFSSHSSPLLRLAKVTQKRGFSRRFPGGFPTVFSASSTAVFWRFSGGSTAVLPAVFQRFSGGSTAILPVVSGSFPAVFQRFCRPFSDHFPPVFQRFCRPFSDHFPPVFQRLNSGFASGLRKFSSGFADGFPRRFCRRFSNGSTPVLPTVFQRFDAGFADGFPTVRRRFCRRFSNGSTPVFQRFSGKFDGGWTTIFRQHASPGSTPSRLRPPPSSERNCRQFRTQFQAYKPSIAAFSKVRL